MVKEVAKRAAEFGARLITLGFTLDETTLKKHLEKRLERTAISDGRWEIYLEQKGEFEPVIETGANRVIIDGSKPAQDNVRQIVDKFSQA